MKKIPKFASESQEREFWASADSTLYVNWKAARAAVFSNLRPSLRTISLRLPEMLLDEIKNLANKRDVPYQSLLKLFLAERVAQELEKANGRGRKSNSALQPPRTARRRA